MRKRTIQQTIHFLLQEYGRDEWITASKETHTFFQALAKKPVPLLLVGKSPDNSPFIQHVKQALLFAGRECLYTQEAPPSGDYLALEPEEVYIRNPNKKRELWQRIHAHC